MAQALDTPLQVDEQPASVLHFPWVRQLIGLAGLAFAIAAGIVVALWSQEPNYAVLFEGLSDNDARAVGESLSAKEMDFRIDERSGALLVPQQDRQRIRLLLAGEGLPNTANPGMEILRQEQGIGTSRFVEQARYLHALEAELSRTIISMRNVRTARVHLALPKQSVFVRERVPPTASVMVLLHSGRALERGQVNAIVHMVAASVPQLKAGDVTVVDQNGKLLSRHDDDLSLALTAREFDHTARLENHYSERIVNILEPLVGIGKVRAQVTASMDFTRSESTSESYDPERTAVISEQTSEETRRGGELAQGIPGALSNQPPDGGTAQLDQAEAAQAQRQGALAPEQPALESRSATRNFGVERSIVHQRPGVGSIRRLSIAVIIDEPSGTTLAPVAAQPAENAQGAGAEENAQAENQGQNAETEAADAASAGRAYSQAELDDFTALVKEAIGFDEARGDSVSLLSSSFLKPEFEALEEIPIWEQPWVWDLGKQVLGGLFVLLVLLLFVRPAIKTLATPQQLVAPAELEEPPAASQGESDEGGSGRAQGDAPQLERARAKELLALPDSSYEEKLALARSLVKEDPARVAVLVKNWMAEE